MKIVGWTEYDDPNYREMFPIGGTYELKAFEAIRKIIAENLRANGYKFTGSYHQNGEFGVPIFDTGEVFQCSQRMWGSIMADAYPDKIDNSDGFGYTVWAWDPPEPMVVPLRKLKATNIIWDTDGKDVDLPREIEIPDGMTDEDEISDFISNETGFCHFGFWLEDNMKG